MLRNGHRLMLAGCQAGKLTMSNNSKGFASLWCLWQPASGMKLMLS